MGDFYRGTNYRYLDYEVTAKDNVYTCSAFPQGIIIPPSTVDIDSLVVSRSDILNYDGFCITFTSGHRYLEQIFTCHSGVFMSDHTATLTSRIGSLTGASGVSSFALDTVTIGDIFNNALVRVRPFVERNGDRVLERRSLTAVVRFMFRKASTIDTIWSHIGYYTDVVSRYIQGS